MGWSGSAGMVKVGETIRWYVGGVIEGGESVAVATVAILLGCSNLDNQCIVVRPTLPSW